MHNSMHKMVYETSVSELKYTGCAKKRKTF